MLVMPMLELQSRRMSDICKYFTARSKRLQKVDDCGPLPDPAGPLSKGVPSQDIQQANIEVVKIFITNFSAYHI